MDGRRSALVVLDAAHVALAQTLVDYEEDLSSHLSAEEATLFGPMAGSGTRGADSRPRGIAVALVLEI